MMISTSFITGTGVKKCIPMTAAGLWVAEAGCRVMLVDVEERLVHKGMETVRKNHERAIAKGKLTREKADTIISRISGGVDLKSVAKDADIVIEAVVEKMEIKKRVYRELDEMCRPGVILASNTSGLSITEIASATHRPAAVIGMHFFNPVPVMKLVEIIMGQSTSDETFHAVQELALRMGKLPSKSPRALPSTAFSCP